MQEDLSALIQEFDLEDRKMEIFEMVQDALAVTHYPEFYNWKKEYGEGRDNDLLWEIFRAMHKHKRALKQLLDEETYKRFLASHIDI